MRYSERRAIKDANTGQVPIYHLELHLPSANEASVERLPTVRDDLQENTA